MVTMPVMQEESIDRSVCVDMRIWDHQALTIFAETDPPSVIRV